MIEKDWSSNLEQNNIRFNKTISRNTRFLTILISGNDITQEQYIKMVAMKKGFETNVVGRTSDTANKFDEVFKVLKGM